MFPRLNVIKRSVHDLFSNRLLATNHHVINKLRQSLIVVLRIRQDFPFGYDTTSWHQISPFLQVGPPQLVGGLTLELVIGASLLRTWSVLVSSR